MFSHRSCLAILALLLGSACSPTFDWRETRLTGSLVVLFPCRPQLHSRQLRLADAPVTMEMATCSTGDVTFAVARIEAAEAGRVTPLLEALRAALTSKLSAGAASAASQPLTAPVSGATPHPLAQRIRVAGSGPQAQSIQAQSQFFVNGLTVYQATVVGAQLPPDVVDLFFESMKFSL